MAFQMGLDVLRGLGVFTLFGYDPVEQALTDILWWSKTVMVCTVAAYSVLFVRGRVAHYVNYVNLKVNVGHFNANGKAYYREHADAPLYRAELRKSKGPDQNGALQHPEYEYFLVERPFIGFMSESTLVGAAPVRRLSEKALPTGLVIVFDNKNVAGVGWRYGDKLVTARHLLDCVQDLWIQGTSGRVQIKGHNVETPPVVEYEHTGADIASVDIAQKLWSQVGCRALHRKQISTKGSGRVTVYGADKEGIYEAHGDLFANGSEQKRHGTIAYRVNTLPGFSGSPVMMRTSAGQMAIVGMHICGDYGRDNKNHGVCASAMSLHLNGTVSCGEHLTKELIMNESALPGDRQEMFDDWNMLHFDRRAIEAFEREEMEAEAWDQVHGDDFEGEMDRFKTKKPKKADLSRMYKGFNEGVFGTGHSGARPERWDKQGYEYLAPPDESKADREVRFARTCNKNLHALRIEAYNFAVELHAPHLAPMLTGFFTGQRAWKTHRDDSSTTLQPVIANKKVATSADIRRIFGKICDGDHTAFIEANQYTYASLVDSVEETGLFAAFRQYRDHGRSILALGTGQDKVFNTKDGKSFFRQVGEVGKKLKKKARARPKLNTPEDSKLLKSLGVEGHYCLPPNDEDAIIASMKAQAAKQMSERAYPIGPDMLDSWIRAMELNWDEHPDPEVEEIPDPKWGTYALNRLFGQVDDKSSGWSARYYNLDKKAWVAQHSHELSRIVIGRLIARACLADEVPSMAPEGMFYYGLADPAELFIKEEPHAAKKMREESWRLIHCTSLVDSMCQGYLGNKLNKMQIEQYQSGALVSHTCGMGHNEEGISRMGQQIQRLFPSGKVCCADASGWDLSVSRDAIIADAMQRVIRVYCMVDEEQAVGTAIGLITDKLVASCHMYSSGSAVWVGDIYGVTSSGSPDTTTQNSFMRGLGAILAGARTPMDAGDDLVTSAPLRDDVLRGHGTLTKEGSTVSDWRAGEPITFTSHDYKWDARTEKWSARFCNLSKCLHRLLLLGTTPTSEQIGGVAFALRNDAGQLAILYAVCETKGWTIPDRDTWCVDEDVMA